MKRIWSGMICGLLLTTGCAATQSFTIRTSPPGADIYVDGERVGKTPATIKVKFPENVQLAVEKKIVSVKLSGYEEKKEVISPEAGRTLEFTLVSESENKAVAVPAANPAAAVEQANQAASPAQPAAAQDMKNAAKNAAVPDTQAAAPKEALAADGQNTR